MNVRYLIILNAVLVTIVALVALVSPTTFLETNGLEVTQYTINQMRVFGAMATGYAVMSWLMRNQPASGARRAFLLGVAVNYLVFAVVNVINITGTPDLETNIGWAYFALNVVLGLAFLYFGWREVTEAEL